MLTCNRADGSAAGSGTELSPPAPGVEPSSVERTLGLAGEQELLGAGEDESRGDEHESARPHRPRPATISLVRRPSDVADFSAGHVSAFAGVGWSIMLINQRPSSWRSAYSSNGFSAVWVPSVTVAAYASS